jgi:NitT/TauT family transport system substrate-binding protein
MRTIKLFAILVGGFLATLARPAPAQESLKKLRISYPSGSICCLPLFGAIEWKLFAENGLQAEIIQVRSQVANTAMYSGEVQYVAGVGPASVSATLRGMPSRAVWFATDQLIYTLIARPEFQNVKDLRNKKIGVTGLGGTQHVALQVALESLGENPKNFAYLALGAPQLVPALETGTIDAAMFSPPQDFYVKKKRYREVLDVGARVKMPLGGMTVLVSTLRNRPDEVKRVLRALQAAKQEILKSKEKTIALMNKFLGVDREVAEDTYGVYGKTVSGDGVPTREGMDLIIKSLQAAGQFTDRKVTFDEIADDRIAKEVARELGYKIQ